MPFRTPPAAVNALRQQRRAIYRADETHCVHPPLDDLRLPASQLDRIAMCARYLAIQVRKQRSGVNRLDAFLHENGLSTREGAVPKSRRRPAGSGWVSATIPEGSSASNHTVLDGRFARSARSTPKTPVCLAEALLRVPDEATLDKLIKDKISSADWNKHLGHSDSLSVTVATDGRTLSIDTTAAGGNASLL